ncbi:hypothetical protein T08_6417 [Trichinella sp. T8]|nr:hypothetical protein T08_6417 [Trichinella sp. T8]
MPIGASCSIGQENDFVIGINQSRIKSVQASNFKKIDEQHSPLKAVNKQGELMPRYQVTKRRCSAVS